MARATAFILRSLPLVAVLCAHAFAQDGTVRTALESEEIFMGESTNYQVSFENLAAKDLPDLKYLETDFKVQFLNTGREESLSLFGGASSKVTRLNHIYRLTPRHAGTLKIPGPVVNVGGRNYKGADLALVVAAPEKQDLVFAEVVASAPRVYPTQEFEVTVRVLMRPLPNLPNRDPLTLLAQTQQPMPVIQINWVDPVPDGLDATADLSNWLNNYASRNRSGFSLNNLRGSFGQLFLANLLIGKEPHATADGSKVDYHAYELKRTFRADKTGSYSFGPASVKGTFVDGIQQGQYTARKLIVNSNEAVVEVRDVPAARPPGYSGGIGAFTVNASAAPLALRVGDPLTLSLTFERQKGAGSLERLGAPDLSLNEKLAADFDIVDKNPTGESSGDTKKFSYSLRPKRAGVSIPEITASLFDPIAEKFTDVKTPSLPLKVSEASSLNATEIVGSLAPRAGQDLRSADQGVFQNITALSEMQNQRVQPLYAILLAGGAWLWAVLSCMLIARRRSFAGDIAWQRRDAARHVRGALLGLIADLRNRPAAGLTAADATQELKAAAVSAELSKRTIDLLETLEALEYAPQSASDLAAHIRTAAALVPELHRAMEKSA